MRDLLEKGIEGLMNEIKDLQDENKELKGKMEKYAAFCVRCDREKLPLLKYDDWNSELINILDKYSPTI